MAYELQQVVFTFDHDKVKPNEKNKTATVTWSRRTKDDGFKYTASVHVKNGPSCDFRSNASPNIFQCLHLIRVTINDPSFS